MDLESKEKDIHPTSTDSKNCSHMVVCSRTPIVTVRPSSRGAVKSNNSDYDVVLIALQTMLPEQVVQSYLTRSLSTSCRTKLLPMSVSCL